MYLELDSAEISMGHIKNCEITSSKLVIFSKTKLMRRIEMRTIKHLVIIQECFCKCGDIQLL